MNILHSQISKRRTIMIASLLTIAAIFSILVFLWFVQGVKDFLTVLPKLSNCGIPMTQPFLWADGGTICLSRDGGNTIKTFTCRPRAGKPVDATPVAFWHNQLIYMSPSDEAVCVVSQTGPPVWIFLTRMLKPFQALPWPTNYALYPTSRGVILNLWSHDDESGKDTMGVINVDLTTKVATMINRAIVASASEDSGDIMIEDVRHNLLIGSGTSFHLVYTPDIFHSAKYVDWTYSPTTHTLYWNTENSVSSTLLTDPSHRIQEFDLSPNCLVYDILPSPATHQVWVTARSDQGFDHDPTVYLLVFTETGKFIGIRLIAENGIDRPVLFADPTKVALLKRL